MRYRLPALAAAVVLFCALAVTPAGATAAPQAEVAVARTALNLPGASLSGVAVLSPKNVWAVGADNNASAGLIAHWNGTRWSYSLWKSAWGIQGITALSPNNIWAAGNDAILHWNGHRWSLTTFPTMLFYTIDALSADNIWAGGAYGADTAPNGQNVDPGLMHWTGKRWYVVAVQDPRETPLGLVSSIAVTGPKAAWATSVVSQTGNETILLRWNGATWRPLTSRSPGAASELVQANSVAAGPHGTAWAFGWMAAGLPTPAIMFWNGASWRNESGPLEQQRDYSAGCFEPNGTGWAVGASASYQTNTGISRWTGKTWAAAPVRTAGIKDYYGFGLVGCAALSNSYGWAVGTADSANGVFYALALRWNGKVWS